MDRFIFLSLLFTSLTLQATVPYQTTQSNDCTAAFIEKAYLSALDECKSLSEKGNGEASFIVAILYAKGLGITKDKSNALIYLKAADEQNHADASFNLATAYEMGKVIGVELSQSNRLAFDHYQKAARNGSSKAQRKLAALLSDEDSLRYRPDEAAKWLEQAAEQGDLNAQVRLGALYLKGKGVEKNPKRGLSLIKQAADSGYAKGQFIYGTLLYQSEPQLARKYFESAASQGDGFAAHNLASIYFNGEHVEKDKQKAHDFAKIALDNGIKQSQIFLLKEQNQPALPQTNKANEKSIEIAKPNVRKNKNLSGFAIQFGRFVDLKNAHLYADKLGCDIYKSEGTYIVAKFGYSRYSEAYNHGITLSQLHDMELPYIRVASDFNDFERL